MALVTSQLHNLNVLAEAAITMLNQQLQKDVDHPQQTNLDVLAEAAITMLNQQLQKEVDHQQQTNLHVLAEAAITMLNQQLQKDVDHQQQTNMKKNARKNQQRQRNVKKNRKGKRPCRPAPRREQQQQRDPERWLLELVAEHGGMGPPVFLCSKTLTPTDTNRNHNRLAIPRQVVHDVFFPLMNEEEKKEVCKTGRRIGEGGLRVRGHDGVGEQRSLSLCFKLWHSNQMFLINDGWKVVVDRNELRPEKDVIELWCFRDASIALHFAFCVVRGEEDGKTNEEEHGMVADGGVALEREAKNAGNDDSIISVTEKEDEKKNHCSWVCKKQRTTYP